MRLPGKVLGLLLSMFFLVSSSPAETDAQRQALQLLAEQKRAQWVQARAEVVQFAKERGIPIRREYDDGVIELKKIIDGFPIYDHTHNLKAAVTSSVDTVWPGGEASFNLTGDGETLGIWDAGKVRLSHDEFGGRVTQKDDANTLNSHATHVAGTMVAAGFIEDARGMAYEASLHAYDWDNEQAEMAAAADDGMQVSNHSYGKVMGWYERSSDGEWEWHGDPGISETEDYRFGLYAEISKEWDELAYTAPYYLIVNSAGNDRLYGPADQPVDHYIYDIDEDDWVLVKGKERDLDGGPHGYMSLGGRGVSKNVLTVGAVLEIVGGYEGPGDVVMTSFSSWGPANDGRIKPDIVAKGQDVYSTLEESDSDYGTSDGTSMSSAVVSGSVGLLHHHYRELHGKDERPLASTIKALLIHSADQAGEKGPDYKHGWGLLNIQKAVEILSEDYEAVGTAYVREITLENGEELEFTVSSNGNTSVKATIAWTDPPGTPVKANENNVNPDALMLVNDLDLRITGPDDTEYEPYILDLYDPSAPAVTGDNFRDNVEQVFVENPEPGDYTISISHKENLENGSQKFSLISAKVKDSDDKKSSSSRSSGCFVDVLSSGMH